MVKLTITQQLIVLSMPLIGAVGLIILNKILQKQDKNKNNKNININKVNNIKQLRKWQKVNQ